MSESSRARLTETKATELNFQLNRGEAAQAFIRVPPTEPGLYSVEITISGFDGDGDPFTQVGPAFTFGWLPLGSGQFSSTELVRSHATGCEAEG